MAIKGYIWLAICTGVIAALFLFTDPQEIYTLNWFWFAISSILFLISILFWSLAWTYLMKEKMGKSLKINFKALMGLFTPLGLGGDFLRAYFAKKEKIDASRALSASFVVKFFKFLIMFVFALAAVYLLSYRDLNFSQNFYVLFSAVLMSLLGAIVILLLRVKRITMFIGKFLKKMFIKRFHKQLNKQFLELTSKQVLIVIALLFISTIFEIATVYTVFLAINRELLVIHAFIFGSIAYSLALIMITPQGIGFVESGGFLVLSIGYFGLSVSAIGSFLIAWNLVRIWIPSVFGVILSAIDR